MRTSTVLLVLGLCLVLALLPHECDGVMNYLSNRRKEMKRQAKKARQNKKSWQRLEEIVETNEAMERKMRHIRNWIRKHFEQVSLGNFVFHFALHCGNFCCHALLLWGCDNNILVRLPAEPFCRVILMNIFLCLCLGENS